MPESDESTYRRHYRATADDVTVREGEEVDTDDEVFEIRMPIATTGEVRNADDDPLTREELSGMARQLKERQIGVFPAHGSGDMIAFGKYSPFERLGDWREAEMQSREDTETLMATARMPDPETLPAATGEYRKALAILKEQAKRGIAQDASIGWRDDKDFQGGVDLMEASIVGIGADWRTNTGDPEAETTASVVARAAVDAGADPEALVESVQSAVDSERPLGPPGDEDRFDTFEDCVEALSEDPDVSREDAEEICGAWESAKQEQDHDMTDDDTDTETDEQDADDGETTRAPDDVTAEDLYTFTAMHLDGMDEGDLAEAVDASDAEYVGECDPEALADLISVATGAEYGDAMDALDDLMTEEQGDYGDGEDDDEEEGDEDEEQSADTEQDADADNLRSEVESLKDELDDLRDGGLSRDDVDTPDADEEQDAEESDTDDETTEQTAESPTAGLGDYR